MPIFVMTTFPPTEPMFVQVFVVLLYELGFVASSNTCGLYVSEFPILDAVDDAAPVTFAPIWLHVFVVLL